MMPNLAPALILSLSPAKHDTEKHFLGKVVLLGVPADPLQPGAQRAAQARRARSDRLRRNRSKPETPPSCEGSLAEPRS